MFVFVFVFVFVREGYGCVDFTCLADSVAVETVAGLLEYEPFCLFVMLRQDVGNAESQ